MNNREKRGKKDKEKEEVEENSLRRRGRMKRRTENNGKTSD